MDRLFTITGRAQMIATYQDSPQPDWPEIVGCRALLRQAQHSGFTLTQATTPEELEAIADGYDSPEWVRADWRGELAHIGQVGTVTAAWHGKYSLEAVVELRFTDGYEAQFWWSDVQFD